MALSAERRTPRWNTPDGPVVQYKMKASTTIYAGAMVMLDGNGVAVPATKAANHVPVGRAEETVVSNASDDSYVECRTGVFRWNNDVAGKAFAAATVGDAAYVEDDETVRTDSNANGVKVGRVMAIDDEGAWVAIGIPYAF